MVFPDTPSLREKFRHAWVLRRCRRPYVPQPDSTPMPDRTDNREDRSRLLSIYLRPWVLERQHASIHVPRICDLDKSLPDVSLQPVKRTRLVGKQPSADTTTARSYATAWTQYVRGRIVSKHAERIIKQFLAASCGKSKESTQNDSKPGREPDEEERKTKNEMNLEEVHGLIRDMGDSRPDDAPAELQRSKTVQKAIGITSHFCLWTTHRAQKIVYPPKVSCLLSTYLGVMQMLRVGVDPTAAMNRQAHLYRMATIRHQLPNIRIRTRTLY